MARELLTGARIRERRMLSGIRQTELARMTGISASYLNLIEHNRRRIGGALLNRIAAVLDIEPALLSEGAATALTEALRELAAQVPDVPVEDDRCEEFADRFPGWAELLAASGKRIEGLEHSVDAMADRMTHDPQLAASLHEVISTVTAIRSTASILVDTREIEPEWRDRFHRNLNEDAARLSQSSQALMAYLEPAEPAGGPSGLSPEDEVEAFHSANGFHYPSLERSLGGSDAISALLAGRELSQQATFVLKQDLRHYHEAARVLPLQALRDAMQTCGEDPVALARSLKVGVPVVMRRLAALPQGTLSTPVGLVVVDAAGTFLFRKALTDFPVPRFGAGCPHWPVFRSFVQPLSVVHSHVRVQSGDGGVFECFAMPEPVGDAVVGTPPLMVSVMMMRAVSNHAAEQTVGVSCRICSAAGCEARRAPPIRSEGF